MKTKTTTVILAASFLGFGFVYADWTLLSNFESDPVDEGWDLTYIRGGVGHMVHAEDPTDPDNMVFYVESGGYGVSDYNTTYAAITVEPINPGETATLFWRYYEVGPSNNFHMCFTEVPKQYDEEAEQWVQPSTWPQLETIFRIGQSDNLAETTIRDANRYPRLGVGDTPETFVPFVYTSGVWYNMWMVVHNTDDPFDDFYQVYVQGGEFEEPKVLNVEQLDYSTGELTGEYPDFAWFRNGTTEPLVTIVLGTESGTVGNPFGGDVWYVDDVYISSGVNITSPVDIEPPPAIWHGLVVDEDGAVDTGDWLGLITVVDMDADWGYAHHVGAHVYVGNISAAGGWIFLPGDVPEDLGDDYVDTGDWLGIVSPDQGEGMMYAFGIEKWMAVGDVQSDGAWIYIPL